ncbi:MAG: hypothetical protein K6F08_03160 [bacterium]|nr:hypothetical protein [bacterium]
MSKFTPNELARMYGYKKVCDEAVADIGVIYQKATSGEEFKYNTSSDNMIGRGVPEEMMPDLAAAIVDEEFKKAEKGEVLEAPEATKEGDKVVDEVNAMKGISVVMPEVEENQPEERTSHFFDNAPTVKTETTLQQEPRFNEYGEIIRGEEQPKNDETIPVFVPPEEQEVIEPQVSSQGDYKDIVNSAIKQEETMPEEEKITEEPAEEESSEETTEEKEENADREEQEYHNGANQISDAELDAAMAAIRAETEAEKINVNTEKPDGASAQDGDVNAQSGDPEEDGGREK